jgi:membrane fusion protein, multidrug efflux system
MAETHDGHPPTRAAEPLPSAPAQERPAAPAEHRPPGPPRHWLRTTIVVAAAVIGIAIGAYVGIPWVVTALNTVSTDDAYVNGHVTFVAPRVAGQVKKVLVDDNYRVKKGDLLVQLDPEPFEVDLAIKKAAVETATTNLEAANAQVQGQVAQVRANRFKLQHAIETVRTEIANLRASVAILQSKAATLQLAHDNLKRGEALAPTGGVSKEDLDQRRQQVKVAQAAVDQAKEAVYAQRVSLGQPKDPAKGQDLGQVPADLDQNYSVVRQALADLMQSAAMIGYFPTTWDATPDKAVADFYKQDPHGNLDVIYAKIIRAAPAIQQAEAKLQQAKRDLAQAELNLRYCNIPSDIDGVVTRRNVNPGNFVQVGQNLMAVRSLTEIWIDANFKETQLGDLRIGQRVKVEVDMYGSRQEFEGRITGFTMGTGQTLSLLPPQNATGNFVKIVQRLPVRIELTDYDPDRAPLFVGLSTTPYVYYKEEATGPDAGKMLRPMAPLPNVPTDPKP